MGRSHVAGGGGSAWGVWTWRWSSAGRQLGCCRRGGCRRGCCRRTPFWTEMSLVSAFGHQAYQFRLLSCPIYHVATTKSILSTRHCSAGIAPLITELITCSRSSRSMLSRKYSIEQLSSNVKNLYEQIDTQYTEWPPEEGPGGWDTNGGG